MSRGKSTKIEKRITWLNTAGGFQHKLVYTKIADAADGLDEEKVMQVLRNLEDNWDKVRDPTSWVCSSLQNAKDAQYGLDPDLDSQLRKRIRWLNTQGGFDNEIAYARIAETVASTGQTEQVMDLLRYLEERWENIDEPTAWVCTALRKGATDTGTNGGELNPLFDSALRKRIRWLNTSGGFDNEITYSKVAEAAAGLESSKVMAVLSNLEQSWETVEEPTAWVCAALRKIKGSKGSGNPSQNGTPAWGTTTKHGSWSSSTPANSSWAPESDGDRGRGGNKSFEDRLWKKIRWLNLEGGFAGQLDYAKVAEQAIGLPEPKVFALLEYMESHWDKIDDPHAWLCSSLRKAWTSTPELELEFDRKLKRRVRSMNSEGGFDDKINYSKIAEAAIGLDEDQVMTVLDYLEESWESVGDPTAWVCAGLRKVALKGSSGNSKTEWSEWNSGEKGGGSWYASSSAGTGPYNKAYQKGASKGSRRPVQDRNPESDWSDWKQDNTWDWWQQDDEEAEGDNGWYDLEPRKGDSWKAPPAKGKWAPEPPAKIERWTWTEFAEEWKAREAQEGQAYTTAPKDEHPGKRHHGKAHTAGDVAQQASASSEEVRAGEWLRQIGGWTERNQSKLKEQEPQFGSSPSQPPQSPQGVSEQNRQQSHAMILPSPPLQTQVPQPQKFHTLSSAGCDRALGGSTVLSSSPPQAMPPVWGGAPAPAAGLPVQAAQSEFLQGIVSVPRHAGQPPHIPMQFQQRQYLMQQPPLPPPPPHVRQMHSAMPDISANSPLGALGTWPPHAGLPPPIHGAGSGLPLNGGRFPIPAKGYDFWRDLEPEELRREEQVPSTYLHQARGSSFLQHQ
mmetsp:Transcript_35699/g.83564  ORF Transcript_35699/g.83564 Transcript_35699/m.83564 type:complete len:843 (+) Transcript_35699:131-2659(+)|eukprot:CAMPEP_0178396146 /NCGR_PEP_ID=MMETSP0689_2-20121128/13581_1 /TAXON_ID=160604 /ORGANISM="Amphidinium massartii, Strain CS-259" /LENGTH=842 /DNA_ID=CAMNT_0020016817 /DNA_START=31 /DNA_END=2559 /DNA_ORIENTATION=+